MAVRRRDRGGSPIPLIRAVDPLRKPEMVQAIREQKLVGSAVVQGRAAGVDGCIRASRRWASLIATLWTKEYERRARRAIYHDRCARQNPEGRTVSDGPRDAGRRPSARPTAQAHRRTWRSSTGAWSRSRAGKRISTWSVCSQGQCPRGWKGSRHAGRVRLGKELPHCKSWHRQRVLPLRTGRPAWAVARQIEKRFRGTAVTVKAKLATAAVQATARKP